MSADLSESQVRTIQERLQSKPSAELRSILQSRDEQEWSPEAFEAIRRILAERAHTGEEPTPEPEPVAPRSTLRACCGALQPLSRCLSCSRRDSWARHNHQDRRCDSRVTDRSSGDRRGRYPLHCRRPFHCSSYLDAIFLRWGRCFCARSNP